jgi:hypothetical protein
MPMLFSFSLLVFFICVGWQIDDAWHAAFGSVRYDIETGHEEPMYVNFGVLGDECLSSFLHWFGSWANMASMAFY